MPYKDYCHSAAFGIAHKPRGAFPHLTYAALSAVCLLKIYRLHGIHNGKTGFYSVNFRNYVRKLGLSKHKQAVAAHAQTIRPELYLLRRFLRGGIYYGVSARCHISGKLKQQRAFAYAGSPPHKTREPGTIPPPATASSSAMPVEKRGWDCLSICEKGMALLREE